MWRRGSVCWSLLERDFHNSDILQIASCGMDGSVKIWSLKDYWKFVEMSFTWTDSASKFPTKHVQFPVLTALVRNNYVDCTRWLGDLILSKSVDNDILLWEPLYYRVAGSAENEGTVDALQKYPVPECDIWFIKFSCDVHFKNLAIGNLTC
jgi:polycomb protein EED